VHSAANALKQLLHVLWL